MHRSSRATAASLQPRANRRRSSLFESQATSTRSAGMSIPRREASRLGQFSWALFDWANQPFFTVVTTFIFAPYFANVMIGDPVQGQTAWAFTQSTAGIFIALLSPFFGAMADAGGRRKPYVFAFQL